MTTMYSSKLMEIISPLKCAFLLKNFSDLEVMESGHWRCQKNLDQLRNHQQHQVKNLPMLGNLEFC